MQNKLEYERNKGTYNQLLHQLLGGILALIARDRTSHLGPTSPLLNGKRILSQTEQGLQDGIDVAVHRNFEE